MLPPIDPIFLEQYLSGIVLFLRFKKYHVAVDTLVYTCLSVVLFL